MKFVNDLNITSIGVDGVTVTANENGIFETDINLVADERLKGYGFKVFEEPVVEEPVVEEPVVEEPVVEEPVVEEPKKGKKG